MTSGVASKTTQVFLRSKRKRKRVVRTAAEEPIVPRTKTAATFVIVNQPSPHADTTVPHRLPLNVPKTSSEEHQYTHVQSLISSEYVLLFHSTHHEYPQDAKCEHILFPHKDQYHEEQELNGNVTSHTYQ